MDKCIAYICETCRTFDKNKPNLMNYIAKGGFLLFLLLIFTGSIFGQPCESPDNVYIETLSFNSFSISWDEIANAGSYEVYYGEIEGTNSTSITTTESSTVINNIGGGTYEIEITTFCEDGTISVSLGVVVVIVDNLEDIENLCGDCYQKFRECELANGYENCDCNYLCENETDCCNFVNNGMVLITPPKTQPCSCDELCTNKEENCCKYINNDTGAMPIECMECSDAVRNCNESLKTKSNKVAIPFTVEKGCEIEVLYPNPFKSKLQIPFELRYTATTTLTVYDTKGQMIRQVLNGEKLEEGKHEISLNVDDWMKGVYYTILETNEGCKSVKKMLKIE